MYIHTHINKSFDGSRDLRVAVDNTWHDNDVWIVIH